MAKKALQLSFNDVLSSLGNQRFDVAPAQEGAKRAPNAVQVRKYGCAAEIAAGAEGAVTTLTRPGVVLQGEIARLLDKGYQKFFKTSHLEIPATAERLRDLHRFTEELTQAIGGTSLYNESLGTTSDLYQYDRIKGRA
ncbi:MAG: hypothetical protein KGK08_09920 [Acidobacteriota bacterium]|nr:hypothetical protein [Acidobacteriota bacterium]